MRRGRCQNPDAVAASRVFNDACPQHAVGETVEKLGRRSKFDLSSKRLKAFATLTRSDPVQATRLTCVRLQARKTVRSFRGCEPPFSLMSLIARDVETFFS